jgi:hypothetical protein
VVAVSDSKATTKMVSFTMRIPRFLKDAIAAEAARRVTLTNPYPLEAPLVREALLEWLDKRGLVSSDAKAAGK